MRISFIGLGHLNSAILAGMLADGFRPDQVVATTGSRESAADRAAVFGVEVTALAANADANRNAAAASDIVVLGVKPPQLVATAAELADVLRPDTIVVSVAAGVTLQALTEVLPAQQPVVRTMPNVALTVGKGVVGMVGGASVSADQLARVEAVFSGAGTVFPVAEDQLNVLTAMAGSGPGYVFRFVNALAAAGTALGLDQATAQQLARLTVVGAGAMLDDEAADPTALEDSIATEGGVTEAALQAMDAQDFNGLVQRAIEANIARSEVLGS